MTLALCFAYADLPAIRALRPQLWQEQLHLALAPGVDRDLDDVRVFLSTDTPTVLVLVRSPNLSESRSSEVMALFARCRSQSHRLAVVEFDADEPGVFVEAVAEAAASFKSRPPPVSAPAAAAIGSIRHDSRRRPTPIGLDGRPCLPATEPDADDPSSLGTSDSFRDIVGPIPEGVYDALARSEEREPTERVDALFDTSADGPDTIPGMPLPEPRTQPVSVRPRRGVRAALCGIAIAAAVSAGLALQLDASPQSGTDALSQGARAASVAPQRGKPAKAAADPSAADSDTPPTSSPTTRTEAAPAPAMPVASIEASDQARVVAALLDAGKVHALDGLLARRASRSAQPHDEAARRCARYSIGGLDGWRLPSVDELRALRRARLLPVGVFWSATKRADGEAFTLARGTVRPVALPRDEPAAEPFCVRSR